jgi:hypothetical protein
MSIYSFTFALTLAGTLLMASTTMQAQQTTNTNCTLYGNTANCTSDTTDYGAQRQRDYENGQRIGNALGVGIGRAVQAHRMSNGIKNYCAAHPGQNYTWRRNSDGRTMASGYCPTQEDKAVTTANEFVAHHKDYKPCVANSQVMTSYIDSRRLDPREKKTYERAYNEMKRTGQLELYAK